MAAAVSSVLGPLELGLLVLSESRDAAREAAVAAREVASEAVAAVL